MSVGPSAMTRHNLLAEGHAVTARHAPRLPLHRAAGSLSMCCFSPYLTPDSGQGVPGSLPGPPTQKPQPIHAVYLPHWTC